MPKGEQFGGNFVLRGILVPLASGQCVLFDQELMRVAAVWSVPAGSPPVSLMAMAQISYASRTKKAGAAHPQPTGPMWLTTGVHPGVATEVAALFSDPRVPAGPGDAGRGPLPVALAHFEGVELAGATAVLHYRAGETAIREWYEASALTGGSQVLRHFEIAPHARPLAFALGSAGNQAWVVEAGRTARTETPGGGHLRVAANSTDFTFSTSEGELVATLAASSKPQRVTLAFAAEPVGGASSEPALTLAATPALPKISPTRRWPQAVNSVTELASLQQNGLILDRIVTPDENPWNRRVRVADLAFLTDDRAAVLTYDGDVWLVDGFADANLAKLTWHRFASGLHESLAIVSAKGVIQVATKNGVMRLYDRDGNGEADWFENFNDQMIQSQTTRSFPLDMALGSDGSTFVTQGGIVTRSGLISGGEGTSDTGGILKISPDGKSSKLFASTAREPFVSVNPKTGVVTATDQQGHYIPSSVSYLVREGDSFGYMQDKPAKLTPPLVWIPHDLDISSSSEVWVMGKGMGAWDGRLLHLSYGNGRLFIISQDLDAPIPQGAAIPLDLKTELPLLHGRMNPQGNALYLAGFQIWGTRTTTNWAIGRLRTGKTPITSALGARSTPDGVVVEFAGALDPASLAPEKVQVRAWNYQRTSAYGSGRYALDGSAGTTPLGIAQVVASTDGKSAFVHVPHLPAAMQIELRYDFKLAGGTAATGVVYLTVHQAHALDLTQAGFSKVDLTKPARAIAAEKEEPATVAAGKALADSLGCVACHSPDGTTEGKVGPTWKGLFGAKRTFVDGTSEIADETYIHDKIMDPQQKKMKAGQVEMPSYKGMLSEQQMESLVLYIKSLAGRRAASDG